jgi:hypothetical protein
VIRLHLKFVEKDTKMDISFVNDGVVSEEVFAGSFFDTPDGINALIAGKDFYEHCETMQRGSRMEISFFGKRSTMFVFRAQYSGLADIDGLKLVRVTAVTEVKETSRRALPRLDIDIPIHIRRRTADGASETYKGVTADITLNSIRVMCDGEMDVTETPEFILGFSLGRADFDLQAKLLKRKDDPDNTTYLHEYIFLIDYGGDGKAKERLMLTLFEYKRRGY